MTAPVVFEDMRPGQLYSLRGGYLLRYQGPYPGRDGKVRARPEGAPPPILAFCGVGLQLWELARGAAAGSSHSVEEVNRLLTKEDIPGLRERVKMAKARGLELCAEETRMVIRELSRG